MSEKTEKIYKFGLVGCGRWGKNFAKTVASMDNVEIAQVYTKNPENHKLFGKKVKISTDWKDVCQNQTLDGIIIATPPDSHYEIMKECIYTTRPFIVEKPVCMSLKDTLTIRDAIRYSRVPCLVDHTQLFNPAFEQVQNILKYQKILNIASKVHSFGPFRKDVPMIWDWAPHDLSMTLAIAKELPVKVRAKYEQHENYDNSGVITIDLVFTKFRGSIEIDNVAPLKYRAFVGTGNFNTMTMFDNMAFESTERSIRPVAISNESPLKVVIESFITVIETQTFSGLDMAVDIAKIIEACIKSIENKSEYIFIE